MDKQWHRDRIEELKFAYNKNLSYQQLITLAMIGLAAFVVAITAYDPTDYKSHLLSILIILIIFFIVMGFLLALDKFYLSPRLNMIESKIRRNFDVLLKRKNKNEIK